MERNGKSGNWRKEVWPTIKLSVPIMAGMVSQMLMGLADTVMIARVGVVSLAAASFVHVVTHPPFVFALGMLSAVAVISSQGFGAKRAEQCGEALRNGLLYGVMLSALLLATIYFARPRLGVLGQDPEVVAAADLYLLLVAWSLVPALLAHVLKQFCESLNDAWIPNCVLFGGVLMNVLLNWILIWGHWGAPPLGLEGAGWATLFARLAILVALILYVLSKNALALYLPAYWLGALHWSQLRRLFQIGAPIAFQHLLEVAAFAFAGLMMGWISAAAIASHQVAISCAATTFMFPLGIGMAVCIRIGHAWGAEEFERVRCIGFVGFGLAGTVMAAFGAVFVLGGELIAAAFVKAGEPNSAEVLQLTAQFFVIAAVFQIVDGLQVTAINALRGIADVQVPALIAILAYWIVAIPTGYLLAFRLNHGPPGLWIGLAIGLAVAAAALIWRFTLKTGRLAGDRPLP